MKILLFLLTLMRQIRKKHDSNAPQHKKKNNKKEHTIKYYFIRYDSID